MGETTVEEAMERYGPSEIERADLLELDDPDYAPENAAIVTGAAGGIGRAVALAFAANGLTVVATDRDEEGLEDVQSSAAALDLPGSVETVTADLTDDADLERIVADAAECGSIRYLANVAGLQTVAPIESFPIERYDQMHAVMQRAPLVLTKHCFPHFRANDDGRGVVANMCSVHGHVVTQDKVAYNTTKFGLRGLTQSIAAEGGEDPGVLRQHGVRQDRPRGETAPRHRRATRDDRRRVVEEVILGPTRATEMMEPYEVANLFVAGCSRYSDHLGGGDVTHDGGMSLTY